MRSVNPQLPVTQSAAAHHYLSPGRINLIGEHTDYNDGLVLPGAINKGLRFSFVWNDSSRYSFYATDLDDKLEISSDALTSVSKKHKWANYLIGVLAQLRRRGITVPGFYCAFGGDLPIGAGVSSSAALTAGFAYILNQEMALGLDSLELVRIAQYAEREFAGVQCGIMDHYAVLFGRAGHLLKLDCRNLTHEDIPLDLREYILVLCDSGVSHSLASTKYNERYEECQEALQYLTQHTGLQSLRDMTWAQLARIQPHLRPVVAKRCAYVIAENKRVEQACVALKNNDLQYAGQLMNECHAGLRDEYEVSCEQVDRLVALTQGIDGVAGSRMMGGGFGGCTISLVKKRCLSQFTEYVNRGYYERESVKANIIVAELAAGTRRVDLT